MSLKCECLSDVRGNRQQVVFVRVIKERARSVYFFMSSIICE